MSVVVVVWDIYIVVDCCRLQRALPSGLVRMCQFAVAVRLVSSKTTLSLFWRLDVYGQIYIVCIFLIHFDKKNNSYIDISV